MLDAEGWFHTGDLGELDAGGNLYFKGREKNVIVTPAGLKIYPQDLEAELRKEPEVRDCVVVGIETGGGAMAMPSRAPCFYCAIFGGSDSRIRAPLQLSKARTRASRRSSKCAAGWYGATAISRALRRKSLSSRRFAPLPKRSLAAAQRRRNRKRRLQRPRAQP